MAEMWKPQAIEVYKEWVKSVIEEASDSINDWESNFINDIETRLNKGTNLTENQARVLERIYAEKTK